MVLRAVGWASMLVLYLALAGQASGAELLTAVVVASGAAAWSAAIRRCSPRRFVVSLPHLSHWGRALVAVAPALARMAGRLARVAILGERARAPDPPGGRALLRGFDYGGVDRGPVRARRATALLIASIGPESYVLRLDAGHRRPLLHVFDAADVPHDRKWMV